ncbi:uncharacterized protein EDB91DRAFT_1349866 [Suillus paluster]|uniref:uncharacterized protein n=1 Tax=Suillus paluster TaxID=48578 RepID=UPI001B886657|nr:uncharacterized protein EDB91DRAFT_1349866 [Suillus paluster]KAG1729346.1 hypothetical protein EDB91DRAFT_1349866 [Suillus paluster]
MTLPVPGTYVIYNIQYSTQDVDLRASNVTVGTPIVGYSYNEATENMLWYLQVVDEDKGSVQLVSLATNTYAGLTGETSGSGIIGTDVETTFKLHERKDGEYERVSLLYYVSSRSNNALRIQTDNSELVWELPDGNNYTQIILSPPVSFYDNQSWQFYPVDGNYEEKPVSGP